jgi:hypothetical protein
MDIQGSKLKYSFLKIFVDLWKGSYLSCNTPSLMLVSCVAIALLSKPGNSHWHSSVDKLQSLFKYHHLSIHVRPLFQDA